MGETYEKLTKEQASGLFVMNYWQFAYC